MSLYDYRMSQIISREDPPFFALIMAAIRRADSYNRRLLQRAFPEIYNELQARYNAPNGELESEQLDGSGSNVD